MPYIKSLMNKIYSLNYKNNKNKNNIIKIIIIKIILFRRVVSVLVKFFLSLYFNDEHLLPN